MSEESEFEIIVSLGGFCQVAYQIERRFGWTTTNPFDWLVTPLDAVKKIFDTNGQFFAKAIRTAYDGHTAVCAHYGVSYHHEYEREIGADGVGRVILSTESMEKSKSKLIYKYNKLVGTLNGNHPTLFIRFGGHCDHVKADPYHFSEPRPVTAGDLNAVCATLTERFPRLPFILAFVYLGQFTTLELADAPLDPRASVFRLADDGSCGWMGKDAEWDSILDNFKFNLRRDPE